MSQDSLIPVANNAKSRNDLIERGFSRQPLRIDVGPCGLVHSEGQVL